MSDCGAWLISASWSSMACFSPGCIAGSPLEPAIEFGRLLKRLEQRLARETMDGAMFFKVLLRVNGAPAES